MSKPTSALRPYIDIAYCNRPLDADMAQQAIRPLRTLPAITVPVNAVSMVELRREGRAYRWRTLDTIALS